MMLVDLTSTPAADLPLEAFKAHLRLGRGFEDDAIQDVVLESYLRAAIAAIEARTGKIVLTRRVAWTLTRWSEPDCQPLPVAPVSELAGVTLTSQAGVAEEVALDGFSLLPDTHRPRLTRVGRDLPAIADGGTVTVVFDAGYADAWSDAPADLREAVFLLAASYYEHRSDTSGAAGLMPFGVMALLDPYRNIRLMGAL